MKASGIYITLPTIFIALQELPWTCYPISLHGGLALKFTILHELQQICDNVQSGTM